MLLEITLASGPTTGAETTLGYIEASSQVEAFKQLGIKWDEEGAGDLIIFGQIPDDEYKGLTFGVGRASFIRRKVDLKDKLRCLGMLKHEKAS